MPNNYASKNRWEAENVVKLTVKINRNQDSELFELFTREKGSKGALAKKLLRSGLICQNAEARKKEGRLTWRLIFARFGATPAIVENTR